MGGSLYIPGVQSILTPSSGKQASPPSKSLNTTIAHHPWLTSSRSFWVLVFALMTSKREVHIPNACQHCQLSHGKWSHRLLCIWNAPLEGKSEIAPQRFESIVKAVGRILLVRELLISCYMTGLAWVQVQYSAFVIPFVERRHGAQ